MVCAIRLLVRFVAVAVCVAAALSSFVVAANALNNPKRPRIALDPKIQARAKLVTIAPRHLPAGWVPDRSWNGTLTAKYGPRWSCNGHTADLSSLVVRGAWSSRDLFTDGASHRWEITSTVIFLGSAQQAELFFNDGALYYPHYCALVGIQQGAAVLRSINRIWLPKVADREIGFRTLFTTTTGSIQRGWGDFVILRLGSVCGVLQFERASRPFPTALENELIRKFTSRAHA